MRKLAQATYSTRDGRSRHDGLRLLSLIASHPGGEACVCELIEPRGLSQPTVSYHLKVLHRSGLLEREKRGTWAYYRIVPKRLDALREALGRAA